MTSRGEPELLDAHFHYWDRTALQYPWLDTFGASMPASGFADIRLLPFQFLPGDYAEQSRGLNVRPAVHIEAGPRSEDRFAEVKWLQRVVGNAHPFAVVAAAQLSSPTAERELERLAELPIVRGVRQITTWDSDESWNFVRHPGMLASPSFMRAASMLADLRLTLDVQVYPTQVSELTELAQALPALRIVVEHTMMPRLWRHNALEEWQAAVRLVAACPSIAVKLGGLGMTARRWSLAQGADLYRFVIDTLGPSRVMFGSNWPVEAQRSSFDQAVKAFRAAIHHLPPVDRGRVCGGNVYNWYLAE